MHPVFVAAVKRNEVGVAPTGADLFATTPPGTIPATVRPPRIPELADAPAVAGVAPPAHPGRWRRPQMSIAETKPPRAGGEVERANFFSSLFQEGNQARREKASALDRMARMVGLRGTEEKPKRPSAPCRPEAAQTGCQARSGGRAPAQSGPSRPRPSRSRPGATPAACRRRKPRPRPAA